MEWIKRNKLSSILLVILAIFILSSFIRSSSKSTISSLNLSKNYSNSEMAPFAGMSSSVPNLSMPRAEIAPTYQTDRLVIEESSMSLVVKDVKQSTDKVLEEAKNAGGFMVSQTLSQPEEAPFATVIIRVPSDKMRPTLDKFRALSMKVSSENILGTDVTDRYVDIEARLLTLNKTKAKFEQILEQAITVTDILTVQRELTNLQAQIDALKGQQQYLEKNAQLSKVTVYLSSDEFSLPYAPSETFRPNVIFKMAVRSLVSSVRGIASAAIWILVYGIIWIPVVLIIIFVRRWRQKKSLSNLTAK